jgi:hypothetical protein
VLNLRRIFVLRRDEVTGKCSLMPCIPHPIFFWDQIEKKEMGEHVAHMDERRGQYRVLVGKPEGSNHLEDPGIDGRIIVRRIFRKWDVVAGTGSIWLRIGTSGGHM